MNKIQLEDNGFPFSAKSVRFMQEASAEALKDLCKALGGDFIAYGCEVSGNSISAGAIVYNGEIIPFEAGTYNAKYSIDEVKEDVSYQDGTVRPAYVTRVARCSASGDKSFTVLQRFDDLMRHKVGLKNYAESAWTSVSFDANVTETPQVGGVTGMITGELKARRCTDGSVTLIGGGKVRYTTSAYVYCTLPMGMRPSGIRYIPVTAYISSNLAERQNAHTLVGVAEVGTDGTVTIPAEMATTGQQEYIVPFFGASFKLD